MIAIRAVGVPAWALYLGAAVAVAVPVGSYHLMAVRAAKIEQKNADVVAQAVEKDKAEKHFAERASKIAATIVALNAAHAAELAARDKRADDLEAAWSSEIAKNKSAGKGVCWPKAVAKELRR